MPTSVSIIITNYNGSRVLPELLQSLREQDYEKGHREVIIVDDASEDNSLDIIRSLYPEAHIINNKTRRGASYSKNRGIEAARHEWLLFLDNDVVLHTQCLSALLREAETSFGVCFQPKLLFRNTPAVLNSTGGIANMFGYAWDRGIYEHDDGQYDDKRTIFFASTAATLIKKSMITAIGMFDADYIYLNEDFDVGYRLHMKGERVIYVPHAVCYHHMSHTMGRDNPRVKYLMERNRIATVLKNYEWKTLMKIMPSLLRVKMQKYRAYMLSGSTRNTGYAGAAAKSWLWILFYLPHIVMKHRAVQRLRRVSDEEIFVKMEDYKECFPRFSEWAMDGKNMHSAESITQGV